MLPSEAKQKLDWDDWDDSRHKHASDYKKKKKKKEDKLILVSLLVPSKQSSHWNFVYITSESPRQHLSSIYLEEAIRWYLSLSCG